MAMVGSLLPWWPVALTLGRRAYLLPCMTSPSTPNTSSPCGRSSRARRTKLSKRPAPASRCSTASSKSPRACLRLTTVSSPAQRDSFQLTRSVSTRRKALQPFELSDGTRIERGQWVCTASRAMMKDPRNFVRPLEFHGFRHADPTALALLQPGSFESPQPEKARPMVDASLLEWQVWGTGRMAW